MNNKSFTSIIMEVYSKLKDSDKQIENTLKKMAFSSFKIKKNVLEYVEKMIKLIDEKNKINRLFYLIDTVYKRLDGEYKEIFEYKYFKNRPIAQLNYSERTFYRKQNKAIDYFCELLTYIGLGKDNFFSEFGSLKCVKGAVSKILKLESNEKSFSFFDNYFDMSLSA